MRYYSRSPEEWKRIDEEKERKRREQLALKRKRIAYLMIFTALLVLSFTLIPRLFPTREVPGVVGPFQLILEAKDEYRPGEALDVKVRVFNREKRKEKMEMDNFVFRVTRGEDVVYQFDYPQKVEREFSSLEGALLFDLSREVSLVDLEGGEYKVTVSARLNGRRIALSKVVVVKEEWNLRVANFEDFYTPGEKASVSLYLENVSTRERKVFVQSVRVTLFVRNKPMKEWTYDLSREEKLKPMEAVELLKLELPIPTEPADYSIGFEVNLEGQRVSLAKPLVVTKERDDTFRGLDLVIEGMRFVRRGTAYDFSVKLVNKERGRKYLHVKRLLVVLAGKEPVYSHSTTDGWRVMVDAFASRELFRTTSYDRIVFKEEGSYRLVVIVETERDRIVKEMGIVVSE